MIFWEVKSEKWVLLAKIKASEGFSEGSRQECVSSPFPALGDNPLVDGPLPIQIQQQQVESSQGITLNFCFRSYMSFSDSGFSASLSHYDYIGPTG